MVLIRRLGDRQSYHPAGSCCLRWLEPRAVPSRVFSGPNCTPVPCGEHRSPQDHQGTSGGIRDTFVCHNWGPPVIWWVEATDASTPPRRARELCLSPPAPSPGRSSLGPAPQRTGRRCTGVLPTLFLDFPRLYCFLLETCQLHVCAGKCCSVRPNADPSARPPDPRCAGHRTGSAVRPGARHGPHSTVSTPARTDCPPTDPLWFRHRRRSQRG